MNRRYILFLVALTGICTSLMAQEKPAAFTWQAPVPAITQTGFYHITLTPAIIAGVNNVSSWNFRLYKNITEVPYLLQEQSDGYDAARFEAFDIVKNTRLQGKGSTIIFHNAQGYTLDRFEMVFKNAWVTKTMRISGSNDKQNWYGVTDAFVFDPASAAQDSSSTTLVKTVAIPPSDYAWYELVIDDSSSAPIFIEKIGRYKANGIAADYTPVPSPKVSNQPGSTPHETRLLLDFDRPYLLNKLSLNIAAPALYRRHAAIMVPSEADERQNAGELRTIQSFVISSEKPAQVILDAPGHYKRIYVVVQNDDNPPLQFGNISAWQQTVFLTAYLEKGNAYFIKGGDTSLHAPVYDLSYFKDSVPANIPVIQPGAPVKLPVAEVAAKDTTMVFKSKWWIWAGIAGIIVFLVFIALRMLKEMQVNREDKR